MQRNNIASEKEVVSFHSWIESEYNDIQQTIIEQATAFLFERSGSKINNLILDNRWHYLDKNKKQGYKGGKGTDNNGVPNLLLTYNSFKQGGNSESFNSYNVIKELWRQKRAGLTVNFKPTRKKLPKSNFVKSINENKYNGFINRDQKLWDQLSSTGHSDYLTRKKLPNIKGIKFSKDFIAVKIINCANECFGLQKIYNDGRKLFTKGLEKKGNFALIGAEAPPIKLQTIHICEGIATAGSVHLATMEPVFAALDARNILNIVPTLKSQYPKIDIIIWADNDQWKANKIHNGRSLGNTGLVYANLAAIQARNAMVVYPEFSELNLEHLTEDDKPTDFNDLHQLIGLNAVSRAVAQKPNINIGLTKKIDRANRLHHGILSKNNFIDGNKTTYNSNYLPDNIQIHEGINLIRSPIGTGKTNIVENYIKLNPALSVLFTTHLISLVENAAQRLALKSYNECDAFDLQMQRKIAICLNSLGKLTLEGPLPEYDVLVIDEVEQVLARLCTNLESKPLIFDILKNLIINCKTVICLDAHLSTTTVDLIKNWCGDRAINIHFNEYKIGQGREIILYDNKESLQVTVIQKLQSNNNVYLALNSRNEAKKTFDLISNSYPDKKGLYISSANSGDENVLKFFNDVNNESQKYDYIICTPSVSTGVSISNSHFNFVGGIFNADINTPNDCMQALGRVRGSGSIHVFCDKKRGYNTLDPQLIAAKWTETHKYDIDLMGLNDLGNRVIINSDYEALCINVTQNKNRGKNNFYYEFCLLAACDGYQIIYSDLQLNKPERKEVKDIKNYYHENATQNNIINAQTIDSNTAKLIERRARRTFQDSINYEKHKLIEFYCLNPYNETEIQQYAALDKQGQLKKQVINLELALSDTNAAKRLFENQYKESTQFIADLKHYALKQLLFKKLLHELQILSDINIIKHNEYTYTKEDILEGGFIDWVINNYQVIQGIVSVPSIDSIKKQPMIFISKLLSKLGIKQKRTGKNEKGVYMINSDSLNFMMTIIRKRCFISGDTCGNYIVNTTASVPVITVPALREIKHEKCVISNLDGS
ncbi:MAG: toprim domain-containing protein [Rickettsiaceae bacterium]|nr:toprim domain-containing protein [Rickettsiaceae bacterium]